MKINLKTLLMLSTALMMSTSVMAMEVEDGEDTSRGIIVNVGAPTLEKTGRGTLTPSRFDTYTSPPIVTKGYLVMNNKLIVAETERMESVETGASSSSN